MDEGGSNKLKKKLTIIYQTIILIDSSDLLLGQCLKRIISYRAYQT